MVIANTGGHTMSSSNGLKAKTSRDTEEWQLRVDLAAAFRLAVEFDWHESVANHFSLAVSADGRKFLLNPRWKHFSMIRASDLLLLDSGDLQTMQRPDAPDPSAWCIHGSVHAALPHARCLLHVHPPYATAMAALADPELKPIDQNTARFYKRLQIDLGFGGIADDKAEGERLARALGNKAAMIMGNHGVLIAGRTVAEAFEDLYFLERACRTMILAYSTGQKLNVMPSELAEKTARAWDDYKGMATAHFEGLKRKLDRKDASYAQ
jgi:ribulose-5-phosphate 4-epimerase/fuculose-1-phosphate aldolase